MASSSTTTLKIRIVGCGGITGYLMPAFNRVYGVTSVTEGKVAHEVTLQDGDTLEERNLDRQLFDTKCVGMNKADALNKTHRTKHKVIKNFFRLGDGIDADIIIVAADNDICRRDVLATADQTGALVIIGGNEVHDAIGYVYHKSWEGTKKDPRVRYPEILTNDKGSPFRCTDEAVLEIAPQTATANMRAAGHILWLLNLWIDRKLDLNRPFEIYQSKYRTETKLTHEH